MQYITPRDDTSILSVQERTFLRSAARGTSSSGRLLRLDGRKPSESRPIRLSFARCHNRSECVVRFASGTRAAASVRAELVPPPNADRPNDGQVKFAIDVGPMGCAGYEVVERPVSNYGAGDNVDGGGGGGGGGADAPYAQRLKSNRILRVLERTLLIGGAMDAEALCVQSGSWVWRLHVDVSLLDDGGNSIDVCVLAAVAALRHYRLPEVGIGGGGGGGDDEAGYRETTIIHSDDREPSPLPLHHTPLTATFSLFADETGTTTSVSALLDPSDREELACDGLLTWAYNKYGEMCCLDFPGGCELRPRQLMSSAKLGKTRCVEICEVLEVALDEAEGKAQAERMERLKKTANVVINFAVGDVEMMTTSNAMGIDQLPPLINSQTDAAIQKEEEEYRKIALDYSSGHFAASVKEDKEKKDPDTVKKPRSNTSSLFSAILRSAKSSAMPMDTSGFERKLVLSDVLSIPQEEKKEKVVEIIAHRVKSVNLSNDIKRHQQNNVSLSSQAIAINSDEEEIVVELQTEFLSDRLIPTESDQSRIDNVSNASISFGKIDVANVIKDRNKIKSKSATEDEEITDLAQALKKKKKKAKKSNK